MAFIADRLADPAFPAKVTRREERRLENLPEYGILAADNTKIWHFHHLSMVSDIAVGLRRMSVLKPCPR